MLPGFTAELSCGATSSYRSNGIEWPVANSSVTPQLRMTIPYWDGGSGGWSSVTVDLPDDPHGPPGNPNGRSVAQCRVACNRVKNPAARRACMQEC